MTIAVLGPQFHGYTQSVAAGFERLGHPTVCFEWGVLAAQQAPKGIARAAYAFDALAPAAVAERNRALLRQRFLKFLAEVRPRVVICIKPDWVDEETMLQTRRSYPECKVGAWMMDSIKAVPHIHSLCKYLDHVFLFEPTEVADLQRRGGGRISFLPLAYDPRSYRPLDNCCEQLDVFFCGGLFGTPGRMDFAHFLSRVARARNLRLEIANKWLYRSRFHRLFKMAVRYRGLMTYVVNKEYGHATLNQRYNETRVSVNKHHPQSVAGLNMRTFEVAGAGGVLLTDYKPALEELYTVGKDIMTYHSNEELEDKLEFLVRRDDVRQRMRMAAQNTARQKHTFANRAETMLNELLRA